MLEIHIWGMCLQMDHKNLVAYVIVSTVLHCNLFHMIKWKRKGMVRFEYCYRRKNHKNIYYLVSRNMIIVLGQTEDLESSRKD